MRPTPGTPFVLTGPREDRYVANQSRDYRNLIPVDDHFAAYDANKKW